MYIRGEGGIEHNIYSIHLQPVESSMPLSHKRLYSIFKVEDKNRMIISFKRQVKFDILNTQNMISYNIMIIIYL